MIAKNISNETNFFQGIWIKTLKVGCLLKGPEIIATQTNHLLVGQKRI